MRQVMPERSVNTVNNAFAPSFIVVIATGAALGGKKHFPLYNLPPKMAAAFQGLITNAGLMAAGMSYSYSSQKQTISLYVYI